MIGLARHTLGMLFHYLYPGLPGMALAVGALAEWAAFTACAECRAWRRGRAGGVRRGVGGDAVGRPGATSIDRASIPASASRSGSTWRRPTRRAAALPPGGQVLVGGYYFEVEILRFSLGYGTPSRLFDDCGADSARTRRGVPAEQRAHAGGGGAG